MSRRMWDFKMSGGVEDGLERRSELPWKCAGRGDDPEQTRSAGPAQPGRERRRASGQRRHWRYTGGAGGAQRAHHMKKRHYGHAHHSLGTLGGCICLMSFL